MSDIPLQQDADPDDPRTALAWIAVGLPHANRTAPLIVDPGTLADWSEHWYRMGVRHHPELQEIKYFPPPASHNWAMGSAGQWGPVEEEFPPEVSAPDVSHLSLPEKQVLLQRLQEELGGDPAMTDFAGVVEE